MDGDQIGVTLLKYMKNYMKGFIYYYHHHDHHQYYYYYYYYYISCDCLQ